MAALPSRAEFLTSGINPVDINSLPQDMRECDICTENFHMQSDQGNLGYRPVSIRCPARHVYCFGCITEWFNFVTDNWEYNNTCPTCRAEVYEPEDASDSEEGDEEPPHSPDQPLPGFRDGVRAYLNRYHGPTNASDELIDTASDWMPRMFSAHGIPPPIGFPFNEDVDVEGEMFSLVEQELRRPGRGWLPPHELYDALLAAALQQPILHEYGSLTCIRLFIRRIVEYLWEGGGDSE